MQHPISQEVRAWVLIGQWPSADCQWLKDKTYVTPLLLSSLVSWNQVTHELNSLNTKTHKRWQEHKAFKCELWYHTNTQMHMIWMWMVRVLIWQILDVKVTGNRIIKACGPRLSLVAQQRGVADTLAHHKAVKWPSHPHQWTQPHFTAINNTLAINKSIVLWRKYSNQGADFFFALRRWSCSDTLILQISWCG